MLFWVAFILQFDKTNAAPQMFFMFWNKANGPKLWHTYELDSQSQKN